MPKNVIEQWKADPVEHINDILKFSPMYCVGGLHASKSVARVMGAIRNEECEELHEIPEEWLQWPCTLFLFEDALENHQKSLLALATIDNESLVLLTFHDKVVKLRELFLDEFGSLEEYRRLAKLVRGVGKRAKE